MSRDTESLVNNLVLTENEKLHRRDEMKRTRNARKKPTFLREEREEIDSQTS